MRARGDVMLAYGTAQTSVRLLIHIRIASGESRD
jgi:hypothetical protein